MLSLSMLCSQGLLWCGGVILNCLPVWLFRQVSSKQHQPLHPTELCFADRAPKGREQRGLHIFTLSASMATFGPGMACFNCWVPSLTFEGLLCSDHAVPPIPTCLPGTVSDLQLQIPPWRASGRRRKILLPLKSFVTMVSASWAVTSVHVNECPKQARPVRRKPASCQSPSGLHKQFYHVDSCIFY